jgi:hypothetical protein
MCNLFLKVILQTKPTSDVPHNDHCMQHEHGETLTHWLKYNLIALVHALWILQVELMLFQDYLQSAAPSL